MFALRTGIQRSLAPAARRMATAAAPKNKLVPDVYNTSFKKNFLSDPATYPLIAVMAIATTTLVGMSVNALTRYKGVKISPERKNSIMRDWEKDEHQLGVTEYLSRRPIGFHADGLKALQKEGLGVDHEAWKKSKVAYDGARRD